MGLASKFASSQGGAAPYPGGPPAGGPGQYPGQQQQQQYQAYPGGPPGGPPQGGPQGAPFAGGPVSQPSYQSQQPPGQYGYPQQQHQSTSPYPQGPAPPPRPGASPQPPYQQPQYHQQQNAYGSQLGPPQQGGYPSPQPPYGSPQPPYSQPYSQQQSPYGQQYSPQQPGYGGPPGQSGYPPQGQPGAPQGQGGYPPQGQGQGGYPPQGQSGGPPGGAPTAPVGNVGAYKQLLQTAIQEKNLQNFYPPGTPVLDQIANRAGQQVATLAAQWKISPEIASDIVKLALYDVILYIDDSGSMAFEENGERIDDLKLILNRVAFATSLFDEDGIQIRFMNSPEQANGVRNEQQVNSMIANTKFSGLTPMGRELQNKILGPLVLGPARSGQLRKPILVITITDGQPTGESPTDVAKIMKNASIELERSRFGKGALAFQFAQVGNDLKAREFLSKLDEEPTIGDIIDCTSNYEVEADEMSRANPPVNLTPELWLIKLLLGSIDNSYDSKDEKSSSTRPPQGGYGGPPQGQYGAPPPGQYGGQQGGYPPQQQYGQQQGGYPPQGQQGGYPSQQQQGQYGQRPPQQGGYPGQQGGYQPQGSYGGQQGGGYGAPPPPRY